MNRPFTWASCLHVADIPLDVVTSSLHACLPQQTVSDLKGGIKSYLQESPTACSTEISPPQHWGVELKQCIMGGGYLVFVL